MKYQPKSFDPFHQSNDPISTISTVLIVLIKCQVPTLTYPLAKILPILVVAPTPHTVTTKLQKAMVYPTRIGPPTRSSIFDGLTLNPLPYPVLLILGVILIFLGIQWNLSYEEAAESADYSFNWLLFATPLALVFLVKWLSSMESQSPGFFGMSANYPRRPCYNYGTSDGTGASPWGVAALIVLLLVLVQYQSIFLDSWFI